jgi:hypothetical protein
MWEYHFPAVIIIIIIIIIDIPITIGTSVFSTNAPLLYLVY